MKALAVLLIALAPCAHAAAPTEVAAEYKLVVNGITGGRVQESYVRKGDEYAIESRSTTEGVVKLLLDETLVYTSSGRVGARGLEPAVFERRQSRDRSRDIRATFDWKNGVMRSDYRGESGEVDLPPGTQDRLSLMYQFMNMQPGERIDVHMSNGRKVEHYAYRLAGEERLKTPAGEFDTLHYSRVVGRGESKAEFWLARDRFHIPVRVVFEDSRGMRLDQTIVGLQAR